MKFLLVSTLIVSMFLIADSAFALGGGGSGGGGFFPGPATSSGGNPQFAGNNNAAPANYGSSPTTNQSTKAPSGPTSVPEPIAALLLGIGLVGVAIVQKRRSRRMS